MRQETHKDKRPDPAWRRSDDETRREKASHARPDVPAPESGDTHDDEDPQKP